MMGIFNWLFGGKDTVKKSITKGSNQGRQQNVFITNAHEFGLGAIELGITGKIRVDGILAIAEMQNIAQSRGATFSFNVMYTTLLEEGALTVPVVCSIADEKYTLYFIYQEEELLKYKDLKAHISRTEYPNLIHFSTIPIYEGYEPKPIIEPFQLADLRFNKDAKVSGKYAMWWSTPDDPVFHQSTTFEYLGQLNELMKGYETYMAGYVLRQTRITQEKEVSRLKLPEHNATYIIDAPEEKQVILDISQEKGIRFLFPMDGASKTYRERFLKGVMVDFAANILALRQSNLPMDEEAEPNSYDWFNFMTRVVKEKEVSGALKNHQIGTIDFNASMN